METKRVCPSCGKTLPPNVPLGLCPECLIRSGFPTGTEPGPEQKPRFVLPSVAELAARFPQFEIVSLVGQGGMGAVYKARQPSLDRFVALKILPPASAGDPGFAERFNREARALARLNHPNIVAVYDFGQAAGQPFLVMEFVDGLNLRELQAGGRLVPEQAMRIVPQICEALEFAHGEGVVHRDIKPENILIDKKGRVKITDFGIAKMVGVAEGKISLTGAKDVVGTPHYMAPEQIEHPGTVDHRADIYSLGVVFYELLTGELPLGKFQAPSRKVQVDVRLDDVVLHALEKEPERRYQRAGQVKTDIETIAGRPIPPQPATSAPPPASAVPASSEQWLERRTSMLWYGAIVCALGLLVSIGLRMYALAGVCIGGMIIAALKLRFLDKKPPPPPDSSNPEAPGARPLWPETAALSCVLFFCLAGFAVFVREATGVKPAALFVGLPLLIPLIAVGCSRLARKWSAAPAGGSRPVGAGYFIAAGWCGAALSVLCLGLGIFFYVAFLEERGGWNPAPLEAMVVPLSWIGALLLPLSTWVLFRAGSSFAAKPVHLRTVGLAIVSIFAVLMLAFAIYIGQKGLHNTVTIAGQVTDDFSDRPISGARVDDNAYDAGPGRPPRHTWTDMQGKFILVSHGEEHTISISAPGYETKIETLRTDALGQYENEPMHVRLRRRGGTQP